jgi:hypothetical protein
MKVCFKCGCELPLDQFYKHPSTSDGHLGKCKDCTKRDMELHRLLNPEAHAERERKRNATAARKATKRKAADRHRAKYPEKYKARNAVGNAVRDGRLIKPPECKKCGKPGKVEAHHEDYSRPLDVEWWCFSCHRLHGHGQLVTG